MSLLLQPTLRLQAPQCEASTSGRCHGPAPRLAGPWRQQQQRRLVTRRAEFSRDPPLRGAGGSGPAVQPPPAQQPWGPDSYQYPPPPPTAAAPPPRLPPQGGGNGSGPGGGGPGGLSNLTKAFIAGAFILGMGAGIWFDSEVTLEPQNLASTQLVDTKTPNSEVCMANGYSSMVFDQRIFVSFNPFNVYVSQPEVKPGCVLRRANFNVLERRGLVDNQQVQACKRNMNTFAFVGDLDRSPEVSCVYHSEEAENQFLRDPSRAAMGDGFQPRDLPPADAAK